MTTTPSPWICATCGNHFPGDQARPGTCPICADERQWVPPTGQRWTHLDELAEAGTTSDVRELEPGLLGLGSTPTYAIGHRGLLVRTDGGNVLWDPPSFLDQQAIDAVRDAGGLTAIASSHPHMYGSAVEWSHAFDTPILLPEADQKWITRPDPAIAYWSGNHQPLPGVTLVQTAGHFPGSAVLHWADGSDGKGVLLTGDTLMVTPGQDRVTFLWSAPNWLPMPERGVRGITEALNPYRYDRIYAGWWDRVLWTRAEATFEASVARYLQFLRGEVDLT